MEKEKKGKLIKLLGLTTSSNDHEALAAIRKVNSFLSEDNKTWEEVFAEQPTAEFIQLKNSHLGLIQHYKALEGKYNSLLFQVAAASYRPQARTTYRKRSRRY